MPKTVGGRLVLALLVALTVSTTLGVALAAGGGSGSEIRPGEARLGDRVAYQATLSGAWEYGDKQPGVAFPFLTMEWRAGQALLDRDARLHPVDHLLMAGAQYTPDAAMLEDGEIVEGPSWDHGSTSWWMEPGALGVVAVGGPVEVALPGVETTVGPIPITSGSWDSNVTVMGYPPEPDLVRPCLAAEAWQGRTVATGGRLRLDACVLTELGHQRGPLGLDAEAVERVGPFTAVRFHGRDLLDQPIDVWLVDGLPYPVRYQATQVALQEDESWAEQTFTLDLVGFEPGAVERIPSTGLGPAPAPVELAPLQPWGLDEAGVLHPFPPSRAYRLATERSAEVRAFLADSPDAYPVSTSYFDSSEPNRVDRRWDFELTDSRRSLSFAVIETGSPAGLADATPLYLDPQLASLPPLPADTMVYEQEVVLGDLDEDVVGHPAPGQVPLLPTAASLLARWESFSAYSAGEAPGWEIDLLCMDPECQIPFPLVSLSLQRVSSKLADVEGSQPRLTPVQLDLSTLFVDEAGAALVFMEAQVAAETKAGPSPSAVQGGPASKPVALSASLFPTLPEAAGATLLGVVLGALYFLWPTLKAGVIGGFSRVTGPRLLEHPSRARLVQIVQAEPGIHFRDLVDRSALPNGTAVHHLGKLTKAGLLSARQLGRYTCYFPGGSPMQASLAAAAVLRTDGARRIFDAIQAQPGLSGLELSVRLGLQPSTVNHHVQKLTEAGLVAARRDGRSVRLSAVGAA